MIDSRGKVEIIKVDFCDRSSKKSIVPVRLSIVIDFSDDSRVVNPINKNGEENSLNTDYSHAVGGSWEQRIHSKIPLSIGIFIEYRRQSLLQTTDRIFHAKIFITMRGTTYVRYAKQIIRVR